MISNVDSEEIPVKPTSWLNAMNQAGSIDEAVKKPGFLRESVQ